MIKKLESGICWLVAGLTDQARQSAAFQAWEGKHPDFQLWSDEDHEKYFKKPGFVLLYQLPREGQPEFTYLLRQEAAAKFAEKTESVASGLVKVQERGFIKVAAYRPLEPEYAETVDYEDALEKYFETVRQLQPAQLGDASEDGFLFFASFAEARKQLPAVEAALKAL